MVEADGIINNMQNPSIESFVVIKDQSGDVSHVIRVGNGKPVWYTVSITPCSEFEELANKWNELITKK